jgi:hypothetical protein
MGCNGRHQTRFVHQHPLLIMVDDDLYIISKHVAERWNTVTHQFTGISRLPNPISGSSQAIYLRHLHSILVIKNTPSATWWHNHSYRSFMYDIKHDVWQPIDLQCPFYKRNSTFLLLHDAHCQHRPEPSSNGGNDASNTTANKSSSSSSGCECRLVAIVPPNQLWALPIMTLTSYFKGGIFIWQLLETTCNHNSFAPSSFSMICSF